MTEDEQDFRLKLRLMRYLWRQGYFVRRNVGLFEPWEGGKMHTDIDVYAIRTDNELDTKVVIGDCKSGAAAKTRERLFWLSGVMKYTGAQKAIFCRSRLDESKYLDLSHSLDVLPLSEHQLSEMEKSYGIKQDLFIGCFSQNQQAIDGVFDALKKIAPEIHDYLKTEFWDDIPPHQINNLIKCCRKLRDMNELVVEAKEFLLLYSFSMLSLSALRIGKKTLTISPIDRADYITVELSGGRLKHEESRRLINSFYDFMVREIRQRYNHDYPISKGQFVDSFVYPYTKFLIDLIIRICENPGSFVDLPRLFDLAAHEHILHGGSRLDSIFSEWKKENPESIKALLNFISFTERTGLITDELSSRFTINFLIE